MASHGANARRLGCAEVWVAHTTWDRTMDEDWRDTVGADFREAAGEGIALREPWLVQGEDGVWSGRSRLQVLRRIPAELHTLTVRCQQAAKEDCSICKSCVAGAFYDAHCRDLDDAALARVEARIEELACLGPHRAKADPDTYHPRIVDAVLQDERGWREWFETEGLAAA